LKVGGPQTHKTLGRSPPLTKRSLTGPRKKDRIEVQRAAHEPETRWLGSSVGGGDITRKNRVDREGQNHWGKRGRSIDGSPSPRIKTNWSRREREGNGEAPKGKGIKIV